MITPQLGNVFPDVFVRARGAEVVDVARRIKGDFSSRFAGFVADPGGESPLENPGAGFRSNARDVRVLNVSVDESGDCYRDVHSAAAEFFEEKMEDWPLQAVWNAHYILRELKR